MNIQQIKDRLNTEAYNFLREDEHLGKNIILLTTGGSYAYGTNVDSSDLDIRGITVEKKNEVLGLSNFEQFEDRITDTVIYGLKKVVNLLLNSNPNVIEMLGTRPEHQLILAKEGKLLKDNMHLFLSKEVIRSFGNYATAQLRRLQNALARDNYPQREKEQHILNSLLSQMDHLQRTYSKFTDGNIHLYIDKSDKPDYDSEIFMDITLTHYPLRDFKNIYSEMSNIVKDYAKLNHRNSKKDKLHLNKHAMHLIRLLIMGTEILEGNGVNTYRENERELLLEIRHGKYTYSQIFEMVDNFETKFLYAAGNTALPSEPNFKEVEELIITTYESIFTSN